MKNTADRTGMNKGNFQGLTSFKGLVGMLNHLGMSEKKILQDVYYSFLSFRSVLSNEGINCFMIFISELSSALKP